MRPAAGSGLRRPHERAHECAFDLRAHRIDVNALPAQKRSRVFDVGSQHPLAADDVPQQALPPVPTLRAASPYFS